MMRAIKIDRILTAHTKIDPVFLSSPMLGDPGLDAALGCTVSVKIESLNPIRSFKGRGTEFFAATELETGQALVCASAGNFGQGLARAATRRGLSSTVYAAENANPVKVVAMRRLGAEVRLAGRDFDMAKEVARRHAAETGQRFVEDGAEAAIAEGAGTIALEMMQAAPDLEMMVVPLGNGALLAGIGAALRHVAPKVEIVAVVAAGAPAMQLSLAAKRPVETATVATIADGVAVRVPVPEALQMIEGRVDQVMAVTEDDLRTAMLLAHRHLGLVAEPSGIVGLAAIQARPDLFRQRRVGTVLCGSNISAELYGWLTAAAAAEHGQ